MYEAMDLLHAHAEQVEKTMFFQTADLFNLEVGLIFYDTTTASFSVDGEDGPDGPPNATLRKFGHSKEGFWAPQVVVALAVTREGVPVRSWVLPGNTADVSTVEMVRSDLRGWNLGRAMIYHPHAHLLVPGVGVSRNGAVAYFSRRGYLVPGKALSRIFRGKFIAMLKAALPEERMPTVARKKDWVVFCKHLDLGPEKAIAYLGRYLNRVAVNDARVRLLPGGDVSVSYRDEKQQKRVRLSPNEFLRRYLQHVLPKGFNKVRRYGLFAPGNATRLKTLRHQLLLTVQIRVATLVAFAAIRTRVGHPRWRRCPRCGQELMQRMLPLAATFRSRSPPLTVMALYPK